MEIMINKCFGGFGYSIKALEEYYDSAVSSYKQSEDNKDLFVKTQNGYIRALSDKDTLTSYEMKLLNLRSRIIERNDKRMIEIVRRLGADANDMCADIRIVEIPDDTDFVIEEYDGKEWVAERHRTWS